MHLVNQADQGKAQKQADRRPHLLKMGVEVEKPAAEMMAEAPSYDIQGWVL